MNVVLRCCFCEAEAVRIVAGTSVCEDYRHQEQAKTEAYERTREAVADELAEGDDEAAP